MVLEFKYFWDRAGWGKEEALMWDRVGSRRNGRRIGLLEEFVYFWSYIIVFWSTMTKG